jgi:hypothetical protein
MPTRRNFLAGSAGALAGTLAAPVNAQAKTAVEQDFSEIVSLCGEWRFRTHPGGLGKARASAHFIFRFFAAVEALEGTRGSRPLVS